MNYRHAFHAGNFADVIKHIVLVRILTHLQEKPAPFRVIDSHAGAGLYDLTGDEATRSGEWTTGIARALQARFSRSQRAAGRALSRHCPVVQCAARTQGLSGSPLIARALMRPQDSMVCCEVEPQARKKLISALRRDEQARVVDIDGWIGLPAYVPPKERRGVVLIDPPYEDKNEFARMAAVFEQVYAKWATGIYMLWYPAKSRRATDELAQHVAATAAASATPGKCLRLEFSVAPQTADGPLTSTGLLIVNPPWKLAAELKEILPQLEKPLGLGGAGRFRLETAKP